MTISGWKYHNIGQWYNRVSRRIVSPERRDSRVNWCTVVLFIAGVWSISTYTLFHFVSSYSPARVDRTPRSSRLASSTLTGVPRLASPRLDSVYAATIFRTFHLHSTLVSSRFDYISRSIVNEDQINLPLVYYWHVFRGQQLGREKFCAARQILRHRIGKNVSRSCLYLILLIIFSRRVAKSAEEGRKLA